MVLTRGTSPQFVGRAAELRLLDELLAEVQAGDPVTALICGDAGSGKTRLVSEVAAAALGRAMRALAGSCTMVGATSLAFAPFAEALRPMVRDLAQSAADGEDPRAPRFARVVATSGEATATREWPELSPLGASAQLGLFEDVLDTLERAAVPSGLLLVIDDLHWADRSSLGLFEFLSRNLRGAPVALVGTVRTDEPDDALFLAWLAEVQRSPRAVRLDLEPFGREELTELVAGVLGYAPSPELASRLYERSGGNAFLTEELLAARDRDALVPGTVQSLVLARVAGLTSPARDLVRLAAVAGVRVSHGLLAAASGVDNEVLLTATRELAGQHLLVVDQSGEGYVFRHALTREAVYGDLLPGERQKLHLAAARTLSGNPTLGPAPGWAVAEAVAEHWFAAGELERALPASVAAGDAARDVLALTGALGHYERALALWDQVADPETVVGSGRPVLLDRAAEVASGSGDHERAIRYVDAAIDELERTAAEPGQLALRYAQKCPYLWWAGRDAEMLEWTTYAVARVPPEPLTLGRVGLLAYHAHGLCLAERYEEASQVAELAIDAARSTGARKQEALARRALAVCLSTTSTDPDAGVREFGRVVAIGREIGDTEEVVTAYAVLSYALTTQGRLDGAAVAAQEAFDAGVELGAPRSWDGLGMWNGAEALFLRGRWDECEQVLGRLRARRCDGRMELFGLALTALLEGSRGRHAAATTAMAAAGNVGVEDPHTEGLLLAAQAQVALNTGDLAAAHRAVVEGLDIMSGSRSPEVVSVVTLAGLGLQVEADRAQVARARRDPTGEQAAIEAARALVAETPAVWTRAYAAAHLPEALRSHQALCAAEMGRAEGRSDPDQWCLVTASGAAEGDWRGAAYAGFREAEALLATRGDRGRAVSVLTSAHVTAVRLAADPLRKEIEALARRARIELSPQPLPSTDPSAPDLGLAPHGLTSRELEVLQLLAAGYTNPQIGEALYISRKTASHHVSSILTKLGVATRVEAAGVAHRMGFAPDTPAAN